MGTLWQSHLSGVGKHCIRSIFDGSNHLYIVTNAARYNFWMVKFWWMDGKILRKIIKLMFSFSSSNCLYLGTIPYNNNLILFPEHIAILVTNAFHHLQPIHYQPIHYWWIGDDETLHLLLLMWPCIPIAMWLLQCFSLPYQLATFMQWSNIWVFNLPAKGWNSKEYKDSTGRRYHKSMWLVHVHVC